MLAMAGSSGVFAHEGGERAYPLPWLLQEGEKKMPQSRFCLQPRSKARVKPNGPRLLVWFKLEKPVSDSPAGNTGILPIEYLR